MTVEGQGEGFEFDGFQDALLSAMEKIRYATGNN